MFVPYNQLRVFLAILAIYISFLPISKHNTVDKIPHSIEIWQWRHIYTLGYFLKTDLSIIVSKFLAESIYGIFMASYTAVLCILGRRSGSRGPRKNVPLRSHQNIFHPLFCLMLEVATRASTFQILLWRTPMIMPLQFRRWWLCLLCSENYFLSYSYILLKKTVPHL